MSLLSKIAGAAVAFTLLGAASAASANTYTYTASGPGADGPTSAQAVITTSSNSITIALTSLIVNPKAAGQEVSGIVLSFANAPASVFLTSATGQLIKIANGVATNDNTDVIDHWGATISGGKLFLATAGTGSNGTKPIDLIIGAGNHATDYNKANPSITGRDPQIDGTGTFLLTLTGAANPQLTGVTFEFGTGPDTTLAGICTLGCGAVPEPSTWGMLIIGFGLVGVGLRNRRRLAAFAAG